MASIEAEALIGAGPEEVFGFLADLRNHWQLTDRAIRVVELNGGADGGLVRIRGPLGVGRMVQTSVMAQRSPRLIIGVAELPSGTRARVSWTLAGRVGKTRVRLAAEIEHVAPLDRVLLAVGGRAYMGGVFRRTLDRLAERFSEPPPTPAP